MQVKHKPRRAKALTAEALQADATGAAEVQAELEALADLSEEEQPDADAADGKRQTKEQRKQERKQKREAEAARVKQNKQDAAVAAKVLRRLNAALPNVTKKVATVKADPARDVLAQCLSEGLSRLQAWRIEAEKLAVKYAKDNKAQLPALSFTDLKCREELADLQQQLRDSSAAEGQG